MEAPRCRLPHLERPFRRSRSSRQLSIPISVPALPFPQQLDCVLSSATHALTTNKHAHQCAALPASAPDLRPYHPLSDNALRVRAPNISHKLSPDPCPTRASACAASVPASHWLPGSPAARVRLEMADALLEYRGKLHPIYIHPPPD